MADERIEAAIAHWAPRFTSQGVDPSDFARVTNGLEEWPEWLPAWFRNGDKHAALAREAEAAGRTRSAGDAWVHAALSYHFAKFVWMVDMDRHREGTARAKDAVANFHRLLDPTARRVEIPLDGFTIAGNLRRPRNVDTPPLVLLLPGLDSTKEEFPRWEEVFLARGLATFSLDGPGQGETGEHSSIYPNYEVAVAAALDVLTADDTFDHERIGAAGVSLGGYYAPRAAAYEKRLKAIVGISGPFTFGEVWDSMPEPTRDTVQHHTGASTRHEARERCFQLTLEDAVREIDQPLLCITGRNDRLIPWEQTKRIADEAQRGEFVLYDEGNHVCNNIPYAYRPLTADWLKEKLG
ncbi:MAG TPA: alpha/beta fold hydrolase [Gaiellaceae bacterium]|nr:alpha/beta fold hydrolase [Gaiellaceae bacterium]